MTNKILLNASVSFFVKHLFLKSVLKILRIMLCHKVLASGNLSITRHFSEYFPKTLIFYEIEGWSF